MAPALHTLLSVAVEAARAALRDLDADQVPNDLRRAWAASGALPPPLAKSVLKGLAQYPWLREKAAEHLQAGEGLREEAAALFLQRPDGWELALVRVGAALGEESGSAASRSAAGKERALRDALKGAKAKVKAVQKDSAAAIAELERKLSGLAAERRAEAAGEARGAEETRRAVEAAEQAAAEAQRSLAEARSEVGKLRQEIKEERTRRRREAAAAAETAAAEAWVDDPVALAERLDHTALMARPAARRGSSAPTGDPGGLRLPARVAPDGKAAIEWLVRAGPAAVLIDGYNLGYLLIGERDPGAARARVGPVARRLHTMGGGALRVTVVYDSDLGPAETPPAPGPVAVRFSEAGTTADDEIVRIAGCLDGPVVVVSNDREVRDRSEAVGATALWSTALAVWAGSR